MDNVASDTGIDVDLDRDYVVEMARTALQSGKSGLATLPQAIKILLKEQAWRRRKVRRSGSIAEFDRFEDFVTTAPLEGLGADMALIRRLCVGDVEALDLLDRTLGSRQGERTDLVDNIHEVSGQEERPTGTSSAAAIRRLRKDKPELHERVLAGEVSPHAAMVQAGLRPKTITVRPDIAGFTRAVLQHLERVDLEAFLLGIQDYLAKNAGEDHGL